MRIARMFYCEPCDQRYELGGGDWHDRYPAVPKDMLCTDCGCRLVVDDAYEAEQSRHYRGVCL